VNFLQEDACIIDVLNIFLPEVGIGANSNQQRLSYFYVHDCLRHKFHITLAKAIQGYRNANTRSITSKVLLGTCTCY